MNAPQNTLAHHRRETTELPRQYARFRVWEVFASALLLMICSGCKTPPAQPISDRTPVQAPTFLSAGDVIKLVFPGAPEMTQSQKIRGDGKISMPMIGEVDAAGKRPSELQAELKQKYKDQLTNNDVVVTVESGVIPVFISGAVRKPGKMVFERPMNLLEVITEAGGFTPQANLRKVRIIRVVNGEHRSQIVDLKPALSGQRARAFYVRPNDVIDVGENFLNF